MIKSVDQVKDTRRSSLTLAVAVPGAYVGLISAAAGWIDAQVFVAVALAAIVAVCALRRVVSQTAGLERLASEAAWILLVLGLLGLPVYLIGIFPFGVGIAWLAAFTLADPETRGPGAMLAVPVTSVALAGAFAPALLGPTALYGLGGVLTLGLIWLGLAPRRASETALVEAVAGWGTGVALAVGIAFAWGLTVASVGTTHLFEAAVVVLIVAPILVSVVYAAFDVRRR